MVLSLNYSFGRKEGRSARLSQVFTEFVFRPYFLSLIQLTGFKGEVTEWSSWVKVEAQFGEKRKRKEKGESVEFETVKENIPTPIFGSKALLYIGISILKE